MPRQDVLNLLYTKRKSPLEFKFDSLTAPPLLSLLMPQDIFRLNEIARSVKLASKIDEKYSLIDKIMTARGFVKLHAGTNRVVYRFIEDQRFVVKVAIDRVGLGDNPAEYRNQFLLKPFVTKVFEVSPCGTVGLFERVNAIMSREEFLTVADDVFNLITKFFVGKYILEDFGSWYFMNWGWRNDGGGLVLLDFPYVYELDGNKLYCNAPIIPGQKDIVCGGQLDYDEGFNNLICTKCGRHYHARDLKKSEKENLIIVGGKKTMKVQVKIGKDIVVDSSRNSISKIIEKPKQDTNTTKLNKNNYDKVESRLNSTIQSEPGSNLLINTIFNKRNDEKEKSKTIEKNISDNGSKSITNDSEPISMNDELNSFIDNYKEEEENDYSEYEDYNQYLSNRQRSGKKHNKKSFRKGNSDFSDF